MRGKDKRHIVSVRVDPEDLEKICEITGVDACAPAITAVIRQAIRADKERQERRILSGYPGATMV